MTVTIEYIYPRWILYLTAINIYKQSSTDLTYITGQPKYVYILNFKMFITGLIFMHDIFYCFPLYSKVDRKKLSMLTMWAKFVNKMTNAFIDSGIYFSLKLVDFLLNIVYSVWFYIIYAIKLAFYYLFDVNMIETSKKRNKIKPEPSNQTVAVRGLINANWQKFLSSNLIADSKEDRPLPKEHFTGTFRRARKKKPKNEASHSDQDNSIILNLKQSKEALVTNGELTNKDVPRNSTKNKLTKFLAMDCEMVGVGYDGADHMLARISIVNKFGDCIYDKFVKPREEVKDYRTEVSGVRKEDLMKGEDFMVVQKEISELIRGRILVGHSLKNDLGVLFLSHPKRSIRDTSRYKPFRKITKGSTPSLKRLAKEILGIDIQHGEHSSVEDARAAMQLYCTVAKKWEAGLNTKRGYKKLSDE